MPLKVKLVCLEDGITSCGFRKIAAHVARRNADTEAFYVTTGRYRGIKAALFGLGSGGGLEDDQVDEIAQGLVGADLVGFSSMTGYADLTHRISRRLREIAPETYQIWGGIHPIIHPEDAITADVDAICTGEGEFAFDALYDALIEGGDPTAAKNFWFKDARGEVTRNAFLPLMSSEEMEGLPFPLYGEKERIYREGKGFEPIALHDYVTNDGLSYTTLWSIGCPFHCTYCGNTKFIANDLRYKRIRHPSARYIVEQVKDARARFPHLSQVSFHDDSFMAIGYPQLEEFAELWHDEVGLPFAVYGVIPNYVKQDKFELLTWAGMNRIRMGIQSGSEHILEFYKRPSPPAKIRAAGEVIGRFAPEYHLPPAYDLIIDNPVETRQDVVDTLELIYELPRPYTLFIYSLKIIPNTDLEKAMKERGIDLDEIDSSYFVIPPRVGNLLLYVLCLCKPPRWLWKRLLKRVRASTEEQPIYPRTALVLRTLYLAHRAIWHFSRMDFSIFPGWTGYAFWRVGAVDWYQRKRAKRIAKPERPEKWRGGRSGARDAAPELADALAVIPPVVEVQPDSAAG